MRMLRRFVVLLFFVAAAHPLFAQERSPVQGVWRLVSYEVEIQGTGE